MTKRFRFLKFLGHLRQQLAQNSIFDGAAALSFYFILATLPALMLILSLLSFFSLQELEQQLLLLLQQAPEDVQKILLKGLRELKANGSAAAAADGSGGKSSSSGIQVQVLSLAVLAGVWTLSSGITAAVRHIYNVHKSNKRKQGPVADRLSSMLLILILSISGLSALLFLVLGRTLRKLALLNQLPIPSDLVFETFNFLTIFTLIFIATLSLYRLSTKENFKSLLPGAIFTSIGTLLLSHMFGLYVKNVAQYSAIYGSLAAVIVMLFWFYIIGFILILGAHINVSLKKCLSQG